MKNLYIEFDKDALDHLAEVYFARICGFNREGERHAVMMADALGVRARLDGLLEVKAILSAYDSCTIKGTAFALGDAYFECRALGKMDSRHIRRIYVFILTAGNTEIKGATVLESFYADTWGTAYVDAARDLLKTKIESEYEVSKGPAYVSNAFGPGFYGMKIEMLSEFFKLLDGEKIGIKLSDYGTMDPVKSCAGLFLVVDDSGLLPGEDCKSCSANTRGCQFCKAGIKEKTVGSC